MTMAIDKRTIEITVNGKRYRREVEPRYLLADFLRHELALKGTHIGCEHGVCGACTVLIDGRTARSCLHFAVALDGAEITTVEGMATDEALHPIQRAFHENHALQCGYCTPGFLMTVLEFLRRNPSPSRDEIRTALANNICRCTGYVNIVKAVEQAAREMRGPAAAGG
jgi:carbon-monoxide dehydrogenase small subunit